VEVEVEVDDRQTPEGPGMLRRAATAIRSVPARVYKRVPKKKKNVKPEPPRE